MRFVIFIFSLLLLSSCNNTTSIDGIVKNAHTGEPIKGASVTIRYDFEEGLDITGHGQKILTTDSEGKFHFSDKCIFGTGIQEITALGFALKRGPLIEDNECIKIVIELIPLDGNLKINVTNLTGQHDSIFFLVQNKCQYWYFYSAGTQTPKNYPLHLEIGEKYSETFKACKALDTRIGWSFVRPNNQFIFQDSVHIEFSDTTHYTISY